MQFQPDLHSFDQNILSFENSLFKTIRKDSIFGDRNLLLRDSASFAVHPNKSQADHPPLVGAVVD